MTNKLIVEQLSELLSSAAQVLSPVDFAQMVVDVQLSDRHLQAIVAAAKAVLVERGIEE